MNFIERIGEYNGCRIGFSCWSLFIIDYFRFYEVIAFGLIARSVKIYLNGSFLNFFINIYLFSHTFLYQINFDIILKNSLGIFSNFLP